jgi:uncharacterized coiled-coil DUF342 family protein
MSKISKMKQKIDKLNTKIKNREEELYCCDLHEQEAIIAEIRELEGEIEELNTEIECS